MGVSSLEDLQMKEQGLAHDSRTISLQGRFLINTALNSSKSVTEQETDSNILFKSGWLNHYTDKDTNVQNHFWRVEDEYVSLFLTSNKSLLYEKIAIQDIVSLREVKIDSVRYCLKLVLADQNLYITADEKDHTRNRVILKECQSAIEQSQSKLEEKTLVITKSTGTEKENKEKRGVFDKYQFALDFRNATYDANKQLRQSITAQGGQISYILTRNTNYLLLCHDGKDSTLKTHKSQKAFSLGIPIVTKDFIEACVKKGGIVDDTDFVLGNKAITEGFSKGKVSGVTNIPKVQHREKFDIKKAAKYKIESGDCPSFPKKFLVPKYAILIQTEKKKDSVAEIVCVELNAVPADDLRKFEGKFRVMVTLSAKKEQSEVSRHVYHLSNVTEVVQCYESLVKSYLLSGMKRVCGLPDAKYSCVVSEPLALILSEIKTSSGIIHPHVATLVKTIWWDSLGKLKLLLDIDPASVSSEQIRNALIALMRIKNSLENNSFTRDMSDKFYKFLPHRVDHKETVDSISKVAKKRELCQLLKDITLVNETAWLTNDTDDIFSMYTALKCALIWLDPMESEHKLVKDLLPEGSAKFTLKNIFRVNCNAESMQFKTNIGNTKLLFHSSRSQSFVGIFSRGLLLPLDVAKQLGMSRRDEGNLGAGIYFSDSFDMSSEFTTSSPSRGSRLMLVNEVALGKEFTTKECMPELVSAPESFNSVKWMKGDEDANEYAVYDRNQQRMCYVIEFTMGAEVLTIHDNVQVPMQFRETISESVVKSHIQESFIKPELKKITYGLVMESDSPAPKLEEIHVRAKIIDLVSEVIIFQSYINENTTTIEAKYVFPLSENAAVCGFEAYINEKHVVGIVKEKEQAHREYKEAISAGQGAYLMDEEKPNVFSVSVGNIPPNARVVIKIIYVTELDIVDGSHSCVSFSLPGSITQSDKLSTHLNSDITQTTTDSVFVSKGKKSSLILSVDMPYDIIDITSPSHKIAMKKTATKACVKLQKSTNLEDRSFQLLIQVAEIHVPRIWIENMKPESENQVAMVTFFPEFDFKGSDDFDCTIFLDMSNSMSGSMTSYAKYLCCLLIDLLPGECFFNVIVFGSHSEEKWVGFEKATNSVKESAKKFITHFTSNLGGSDIQHLLNSIGGLQDSKSNKLHNVFLFSDGNLTEENRLLKSARMISNGSKSFTRIFTFGIGNFPNSHVMQSLSLLTGGAYEHFSPTTKNSWESQLQKQIVNSKQPVLTDVYIDWRNNSDDTDTDTVGTILQVPEKMKCVFNGSRLVAYSFLPNCMQATLHATVCGKKFSMVVTAHDLCKVTGDTLHKLAVKNVFNEFERGVLSDDSLCQQMLIEDRKSQIISLSIKYSVVSKFTSFLAIEDRQKHEDLSILCGPTVSELLESSFADIISEVSWGNEGKTTAEKMEDLLEMSSQIEPSSILQARDMAQEAKQLYDSLPEPDLVRKLVLSARFCELNLTQDKFNAWHDLKSVLLRRDGSVNYEIVNTISRSNNIKHVASLRELASKCWPEHCSVNLASINSKLQPMVVGAFVVIRNSNPAFLKSIDHFAEFWKLFKAVPSAPDETEVTERVMRLVSHTTDILIKKFSAGIQLDRADEIGMMRKPCLLEFLSMPAEPRRSEVTVDKSADELDTYDDAAGPLYWSRPQTKFSVDSAEIRLQLKSSSNPMFTKMTTSPYCQLQLRMASGGRPRHGAPPGCPIAPPSPIAEGERSRHGAPPGFPIAPPPPITEGGRPRHGAPPGFPFAQPPPIARGGRPRHGAPPGFPIAPTPPIPGLSSHQFISSHQPESFLHTMDESRKSETSDRQLQIDRFKSTIPQFISESQFSPRQPIRAVDSILNSQLAPEAAKMNLFEGRSLCFKVRSRGDAGKRTAVENILGVIQADCFVSPPPTLPSPPLPPQGFIHSRKYESQSSIILGTTEKIAMLPDSPPAALSGVFETPPLPYLSPRLSCQESTIYTNEYQLSENLSAISFGASQGMRMMSVSSRLPTMKAKKKTHLREEVGGFASDCATMLQCNRIPQTPNIMTWDDDEEMYDDSNSDESLSMEEFEVLIEDILMASRCNTDDWETTSLSDTDDCETKKSLFVDQSHDDLNMSSLVLSLMSSMNHSRDKVKKSIISRLKTDSFWKYHTLDLGETEQLALVTVLSTLCENVIEKSGARSLGTDCMSAALNMLLTAVFLEILKILLVGEKDMNDVVSRAADWLKRTDEYYPSLYSRLELGSSWEKAARTVIVEASLEHCT